MKAKICKVVLSVLQLNNMSPDNDILQELECNRFFIVKGKSIQSKEIDWSDDHPLNMHSTEDEAFRNMFPE